MWLSSPVFAQVGYNFYLNGRDFHPPVRPIYGDGDAPVQGDLIEVEDAWLVLGPPGDYRFFFERDSLYHQVDGGPRDLVAIRVDEDSDPLAKLGCPSPSGR